MLACCLAREESTWFCLSFCCLSVIPSVSRRWVILNSEIFHLPLLKATSLQASIHVLRRDCRSQRKPAGRTSFVLFLSVFIFIPVFPYLRLLTLVTWLASNSSHFRTAAHSNSSLWMENLSIRASWLSTFQRTCKDSNLSLLKLRRSLTN